MKKIYAIVISFNPCMELLTNEYDSICQQVEKIVYIDNASKNREDVCCWAKEREKAHLILLNDNEGIGVAQNAGIKYALSEGSTHIVLFDQDSVVEEGFVSSLYSVEQTAIKDGLKVGITAPIYKSIVDGYEYPILTVEKNNIKTISTSSFDIYCPVTHAIASGSLIRKEVFEDCGYINEEMFISHVDFEYCFRIAKKGYVTIRTKLASMKHLMGDKQITIWGHKVGIYSPYRRYYTSRNCIYIYKLPYYPKVLSRNSIKLSVGRFIIGCLYGPSRWRQFKFCIRGFYDGIRGNMGKCPL